MYSRYTDVFNVTRVGCLNKVQGISVSASGVGAACEYSLAPGSMNFAVTLYYTVLRNVVFMRCNTIEKHRQYNNKARMKRVYVHIPRVLIKNVEFDAFCALLKEKHDIT